MNTLRNLLPFLLICCCAFAKAQEITTEQAEKIATEFFIRQHQRKGTDARHIRLRPTTARTPQLTAALNRNIHVFNAEGNRGFVLVAGDCRAKEILGYSLTGQISFDNMPVQLQSLLESYQRQMDRLAANGEPAVWHSEYAGQEGEGVMRAPLKAKSVGPLLGGIQWNQDAPFNNLCPLDRYYSERTPAGCVAIAAAQIMRFYRYPDHGIGARNYSTDTQRLPVSADFENTTYDWANMSEDYNGAYSEVEANAVATLAYHVGVACKMDYDYLNGSGATAKETAKAFTRYFNYDRNLEYVDRTHYNEADWEAVLRKEIDAGRPVLQFGEGPAGGHAFVCDGYDEEGLFHYNWGWGGMSDGYFQSSALDPEYLGIGSGLGSYNHLQSALCNIQPPCETSTHVAGLHLAKTPQVLSKSTGRHDGNTATVSFYNYGLRNFSGEVVAALYGESGEMTCILATKELKKLAELTGGTAGTKYTFTIPADIAEGTYTLRFAHREEGTEEYIEMRAPVTQSNFLTVGIEADKVTYTTPDAKARLSLVKAPEVLTPLYNGLRATFRITVRNDGPEFYSYMGILLQKQNTGTERVRQYVGLMLTRIPEGSTRTFTYTADGITVPAGNYDVVAVCDHENAQKTYYDAIGPDSLMVTQAPVKIRPFLDGDFNLTTPLTITPANGSGTIEANRPFTVTAELTNKGGYADGAFAVLFLNRAEEVIGNTNITYLSLNTREKKTLQFTHKLNVEPGQYAAILTMVNENNEASPVQPAENCAVVFDVHQSTGITSTETDNNLRASVMGNTLHVSANAPMTRLQIYTLQGALLTECSPQSEQTTLPHPSPGIYLIRAITEKGAQTIRFRVP